MWNFPAQIRKLEATSADFIPSRKLAPFRLFGASTPLRRVVDLGTGNGCLAAAAAKRWHNAKIVTVDVDPDCVGGLTEQMSECGSSRHHYFVPGALDFELPTALSGGEQSFGEALYNPPSNSAVAVQAAI